MSEVIGRLNGDDLLRWRKLVARDTAIHIHPPHWSREEICHHLLESQRFRAEVAARFEVDDTRSWRISAWTGVIWYDD